jgi:hypothetical protein
LLGETIATTSIFGSDYRITGAIISMRYDATELMDGLTEVLCYGTAVIVEAESKGGFRRGSDSAWIFRER